jgi:type VI secretion system secreted protein VgrG
MSPRYSQETRAFRVAVGSLAPDALLLDGFSCTSRVSEPFRVSLQLLSENDSVNVADVLRQPVLVAMGLPDGSRRFIHGFCNRFAQRGKDEDLTAYEAEVVPWLWFLSLTQDCRIFQEKNALEIVEEIFGKYGSAEYEIRCVETPPQREYCVQYRESDLDFVSRLMEEEGIFYFFEHSEEGHKLIIADDSSAIHECEGQEVFRIAATATARTDEDVIEVLEREHQVFTSRVTLTDFDPLQPSLDLASSASDESLEELYDYPGLYDRLPKGERYALIRLQERAASQHVVRGTGKCRAFRTGFKFDLSEHYRPDTNQTYFLLSVWESGYNGGYRTREGEAEYSNSFECVLASVDYRPPRKTPKPVVQGSQTAFVVGPSGEEIYTDRYGQVKIQFHWDREGRRDENSSCWIRVSHPWAGKGWGSVAIPRIGQEVIVDFLEGDPDRPIITGRVYNAEAMPPYGLPDQGMVSGLKSDTHKGSGYNEISMNDTAGKEKITIHAQKDLNATILNDETNTVGNNQTITVQKGDRKITVDKGKIEEVAHLGISSKSRTKEISHTAETYYVSQVSSGKSNMQGNKDGNSQVWGEQAVTIWSKQKVGVQSDSGPVNVKAGTKTEVDAGSEIELKVGGSTIKITSGQIELKLGGSSVTLSPAGVEVKGATITSEATGPHQVKGLPVKIN